MPLDARASMFGDLASGCPPRQPSQSFRSSTMMKTMSGRAWSSHRAVVVPAAQTKNARRQLLMDFMERIICLRVPKAGKCCIEV